MIGSFYLVVSCVANGLSLLFLADHGYVLGSSIVLSVLWLYSWFYICYQYINSKGKDLKLCKQKYIYHIPFVIETTLR